RLFDGIWNTSVVFANQLEVFFGQGIMTSRPGNSHIGKPLRVIDQGETMIHPVTFEDYIEGLRSSWNAQSHHLLERNCNNFSKEVLSFLNGSDVPDYILSLPHQFLSTPLGASMRPMIDQMFR
ncbi:PPPDE putative peptidase domain-containing protein, partial [Phakopsora pachyrhizi]